MIKIEKLIINLSEFALNMDEINLPNEIKEEISILPTIIYEDDAWCLADILISNSTKLKFDIIQKNKMYFLSLTSEKQLKPELQNILKKYIVKLGESS